MNHPRLSFITQTAFLTSLIIALATPGSFADEAEHDRRILTVSAQSSVEIPTTHARITIMIEAREKTPKEAQSSIARRSNPVLDFLKSEEVEKLQTSGLSLTPIFERHAKRPDTWSSQSEIVGYSAQWSTSFEVTVERAGEIADAVVEKGADRISGFQLKATDEAVEAARTEALSQAAQQARDRGIAAMRGCREGPVTAKGRRRALRAVDGGSKWATSPDQGSERVDLSHRIRSARYSEFLWW